MTLQTSSEGGRHRFGSKVNLERLHRGLELERETRNSVIMRRTVFRTSSTDVEDKLGVNLLLEEGELEELSSMDPDIKDKLGVNLLQEQGELW